MDTQASTLAPGTKLISSAIQWNKPNRLFSATEAVCNNRLSDSMLKTGKSKIIYTNFICMTSRYVKQVRTFLHCAGYIRRFVFNVAGIAAYMFGQLAEKRGYIPCAGGAFLDLRSRLHLA